MILSLTSQKSLRPSLRAHLIGSLITGTLTQQKKNCLGHQKLKKVVLGSFIHENGSQGGGYGQGGRWDASLSESLFAALSKNIAQVWPLSFKLSWSESVFAISMIIVVVRK